MTSAARGVGLFGFSRHRDVGGIDIFHLLFVNNTLIFCGVDLDHLCRLRCLFLCFEVDSDLKNNLAKSKLVPVSNVNNVENLAHTLGCKVSSLPMKYLGLLLGFF
jgi:hypothetical protein